jgi:hypothetical protein
MALSTLPDQLEKANPDESDKLFNDVYGSDVARGINELSGSERSERGI